MNNEGSIVLICGLPGSGKSSLVRELINISKKGVHLEVDKIRSMFHSDINDPEKNKHWSEEVESQFRLER
jgi:ABC-type proline/glycine betaine transport system ATPase subunit